VVTKFQFSALFADAWSKGMTIGNVTSGFHGTGIYPFSPSMVMNKFLAEFNSSSQPSRIIRWPFLILNLVHKVIVQDP